MRSFDYLQSLYNSGAAKKEALYIPKSFNSQGREAVRSLIRNYRNSQKVPDHILLQDIKKRFGEAVPQKGASNLFRKLLGLPQKKVYNYTLSDPRYFPYETIKYQIPKHGRFSIPEADILHPEKHGLPRELMDRDYLLRHNYLVPDYSPYSSIHNYKLALRRKKLENLIREAKRNGIPRSKLAETISNPNGVYRAFRGNTWYDTSTAIQEMSDKYIDEYIKNRALFVSQHPKAILYYLGKQQNTANGGLVVFKDPKLRKFVENTSTSNQGAYIPLRDRLTGKAHRDKNLKEVFDMSMYNLPPNTYEAVLPYSTYKQYISNPKNVDVYMPIMPNNRYIREDNKLDMLFNDHQNVNSYPLYYRKVRG